MSYHISPNGSAGGCFPACAVFGGISSLTCTIFASTYFGGILRNHVFHISPQGTNLLLWVITLILVLKLYTGARENWLACLEIRFLHYYLFCSVSALWHKAYSAHY